MLILLLEVIKMKLRLRLRIFDEIEIWIPLITKSTVKSPRMKTTTENNNNKLNYLLGFCGIAESPVATYLEYRGVFDKGNEQPYFLLIRTIWMIKLFMNWGQIMLLNSKTTDLDWYYSKYFWKLNSLFATYYSRPLWTPAPPSNLAIDSNCIYILAKCLNLNLISSECTCCCCCCSGCRYLYCCCSHACCCLVQNDVDPRKMI